MSNQFNSDANHLDHKYIQKMELIEREKKRGDREKERGDLEKERADEYKECCEQEMERIELGRYRLREEIERVKQEIKRLRCEIERANLIEKSYVSGMNVIERIEADHKLDDYLESTMKQVYSSFSPHLRPVPPLTLKRNAKLRFHLNAQRLWQETTGRLRERWYVNEKKKLDAKFSKKPGDQLDEEGLRAYYDVEKKRADAEKRRADQEQFCAQIEQDFLVRLKIFADALEIRVDKARQLAASVKKRADWEESRADRREKLDDRLERFLTRKLTNLVKQCRYFFQKRFYF